MSIVTSLRALIKAKGGSTAGINRVSDGIDKLKAIEDAANPLSALTVDTTIGASVDLLGKVVGDLQKDIVIGPNAITGTLYYIDDYTGFSGNKDEQSGWYLAVHATVPEVSDVTIKLKITTREGDKILDPSDGILIQRLTDWHINQKIKLTFTAYKTGYVAYSKTFDLSGLTLGPAKAS